MAEPDAGAELAATRAQQWEPKALEGEPTAAAGPPAVTLAPSLPDVPSGLVAQAQALLDADTDPLSPPTAAAAPAPSVDAVDGGLGLRLHGAFVYAVPQLRPEATSRRSSIAAPTPDRRSSIAVAVATPDRRNSILTATPERKNSIAAPTSDRRNSIAAPTPRNSIAVQGPAPARKNSIADALLATAAALASPVVVADALPQASAPEAAQEGTSSTEPSAPAPALAGALQQTPSAQETSASSVILKKRSSSLSNFCFLSFFSFLYFCSFCIDILHSCNELLDSLVAVLPPQAPAPAVASIKQPPLPESDSPVVELPSKAFFGSIGAGAGAGAGAGLVSGPGREHLPGGRDLSWVGPLGVGVGSGAGAGVPRRRLASDQWVETQMRALRRQTTTAGDSPVQVDPTAQLEVTMRRLQLEQRKHQQQLEDTLKVSAYTVLLVTRKS